MRQTTARSVGKERFRPSSREAAAWQNNRKKEKRRGKTASFVLYVFLEHMNQNLMLKNKWVTEGTVIFPNLAMQARE